MNALEKKLAAIKANIEAKNKNTNVVHEENRNIKDNSVTKSNALARSYYRFSLVEKRCMEALISKLHPMRTDNELQHIELKATDYAAAFNVAEKIAYRDLKNAVGGLMGRVIMIPLDEREDYTLMLRAKYKDRLGIVECCFNPLIVPHLIGLQSRFTSYPLKNAVNFKSSYTWRLYELLISWAQPKDKTNGMLVGWVTIEVEELRKIMGIPKSYRWVNINAMLNSSIKEIEEKANIHVSIERQKTVRTITHLKISFIEDSQQKLKGM